MVIINVILIYTINILNYFSILFLNLIQYIISLNFHYKMTTATPSTLTLTQKKRLWKQYKYDTFEQISQDKSTMFNWFLENNDILGVISREDQFKSKMVTLHVMNSGSNAFLGTIGGVFFIDQVLLRFAFPQFRINRFRFFVTLFKYMLIPCIGYTINKQFFMDKQMNFFFQMQEKYSFGFQDYMKANKVFERALEVDRLEELREKRQNFDWSGVPFLQQQQKK